MAFWRKTIGILCVGLASPLFGVNESLFRAAPPSWPGELDASFYTRRTAPKRKIVRPRLRFDRPHVYENTTGITGTPRERLAIETGAIVPVPFSYIQAEGLYGSLQFAVLEGLTVGLRTDVISDDGITPTELVIPELVWNFHRGQNWAWAMRAYAGFNSRIDGHSGNQPVGIDFGGTRIISDRLKMHLKASLGYNRARGQSWYYYYDSNNNYYGGYGTKYSENWLIRTSGELELWASPRHMFLFSMAAQIQRNGKDYLGRNDDKTSLMPGAGLRYHYKRFFTEFFLELGIADDGWGMELFGNGMVGIQAGFKLGRKA